MIESIILAVPLAALPVGAVELHRDGAHLVCLRQSSSTWACWRKKGDELDRFNCRAFSNELVCNHDGGEVIEPTPRR